MHQEAITAVQRSNFDTDHTRNRRSRNRVTEQPHTIFQKCLASQRLTADEKCADRLAQEAFTIVVAGGEATARVLSTATFHVIANKHRVLPMLRLELETAFPDASAELDLKTLEKLPWLVCDPGCPAQRTLLTTELQTAVIKESLRISTLVVSRLPLVAPYDVLRYKQWSIPPGTPVSMSLRDVLMDESIYEHPAEFLPERWLAEDGNHSRRARFYLPFSRGSRMCIGFNLAMAELYLVMGTMFRRFDLELYHTTRERDVDVARDCFVGEPCRNSVGVRVEVRPVPQFGSATFI
jgi:cytochrome P450